MLSLSSRSSTSSLWEDHNNHNNNNDNNQNENKNSKKNKSSLLGKKTIKIPIRDTVLPFSSQNKNIHNNKNNCQEEELQDHSSSDPFLPHDYHHQHREVDHRLSDLLSHGSSSRTSITSHTGIEDLDQSNENSINNNNSIISKNSKNNNNNNQAHHSYLQRATTSPTLSFSTTTTTVEIPSPASAYNNDHDDDDDDDEIMGMSNCISSSNDSGSCYGGASMGSHGNNNNKKKKNNKKNKNNGHHGDDDDDDTDGRDNNNKNNNNGLDDVTEAGQQSQQQDVHLQYTLTQIPPFSITIMLGCQNALMSLSGIVLLPLTLVPIMGGTRNQIAELIGTICFGAGISTMIQTLLGTRLPILQGVSFAYLPSILNIIVQEELQSIQDPNERFEQTMQVISGSIVVHLHIYIIIILVVACWFFF